MNNKTIAMAEIARVVALGASNLTRGFHAIVSAARSAWGPEIQVLAAMGHGRSYGTSSKVLFHTLPGILDSGLWRALELHPGIPTRALVTDVGNDILYGYSAAQTLAWVHEAINRLLRVTRDIVVTDLPLASIQRLSQARFLLFRSILYPACRLSLAEVVERVELVNGGLGEMAVARGLKFFRLNPSWYGFDPAHIRPALWQSAWREIFNVRTGTSKERGLLLEGLQLFLMPFERRRIFGIERFTPQSGVNLHRGGRVWIY